MRRGHNIKVKRDGESSSSSGRGSRERAPNVLYAEAAAVDELQRRTGLWLLPKCTRARNARVSMF